MKRATPLRRRTRLQSRSRLVRRTPMPRQRMKPAVPDAVRALLTARSGGRCEVGLPGCWGQATDPHHRVTRGAGGRHGAARLRSDRLSSLIDACRLCHTWIHTRVAWAHDLGLLLHEHQDPTAEPALLLAHDHLPVFLTDDGRVLTFEEAGL